MRAAVVVVLAWWLVAVGAAPLPDARASVCASVCRAGGAVLAWAGIAAGGLVTLGSFPASSTCAGVCGTVCRAGGAVLAWAVVAAR
jgi:hypothetical protein